jgi:trans-aconitate methyltransferase
MRVKSLIKSFQRIVSPITLQRGKMWENYGTHKKLLEELFENFDTRKNYRILDAGSGRTSLHFLTTKFPNANITAIVYPGDERKIEGIKEFVHANNYVLKEIDIRNFKSETEFDMILAHLLLGEATKFGNRFNDVLNALFSIKTRYLVIVDVLEDTDVDYRSILAATAQEGSIKKINFSDRYIGFLISKKEPYEV